jgi:O-antigen ligase
VPQGWPLWAFEIGIYGLVAVYLLVRIQHTREHLAHGVVQWLLYLTPVWGMVQILLHTTASTIETRQELLKWGALAGVLFLSQVVTIDRSVSRLLLNAFVGFATVEAILCIAQLYTSEGLVLWMFPSGYPDVYATFQSPNNYAQFAELALPIAAWRTLREGWRAWGFALAASIIYASTIASASRAGTLLCTGELLLVLILSVMKGRSRNGSSIQATLAYLLLIPVLAGVFAAVVGWQHVVERFHDNNPYVVRREFLISAINMAKHKPWTGFGLGTFPEVYQKFAIKDFPFYANHAHNDWAEFAADGGIPFLLMVLLPFLRGAYLAVKHPWGIGLIAVMLHACVDYPFPRPAVSGWMFLLLALLLMADTFNRRDRNRASEVEEKRRLHAV